MLFENNDHCIIFFTDNLNSLIWLLLGLRAALSRKCYNSLVSDKTTKNENNHLKKEIGTFGKFFSLKIILWKISITKIPENIINKKKWTIQNALY